MSSGLSAPKCPSCKIILLRPLHSTSSSPRRVASSSASAGNASSSPRRASSSAGGIIMQCSACRNQYSVRKGSVIPAILVNSTQCLSAHLSASTAAADLSTPNSSPVRRGLVSPLAATIAPTRCDLMSPQHLSHLPLPKSVPARSRSFNGNGDCKQNKTLSPTTSVAALNGTSPSLSSVRRRGHHRTSSLHSMGHSMHDSGHTPTLSREQISQSSSSDRLILSEIKNCPKDKSSGGKLSKFTAFISNVFWGKGHISSEPSPKRTADLPPVHRAHKRRLSLSDLTKLDDMPSVESGKHKCLTTLENLLEDHSKAKNSGNYSHLKELYANTFSSWEDICSTFKMELNNSEMDLGFGIDMKLVHCTYTILMEMPKDVQKAVMKSIINSFLKQSRYLHSNGRDSIRAQLILIENPQFKSPSAYIIFAQLLKQLSQMSPDVSKSVVSWLRNDYRPEWIKYLIANIQRFIALRQFPTKSTELPPSAISKTSWWIPCAMKVLALLNEATMGCTPPMLSHSDFYITSLDHIDLMVEFYAWQNPGAHSSHSSLRFSYCQYPFILSLSAKKLILQCDSQHQMLMMAMRSLADNPNQNKLPDAQNAFLNLKIRRSHLIEDSINELIKKKGDLKKKVKITFSGEPGVDMGGLTKEWFMLVVRKIFNPKYGLFTCYEQSEFFWFSLGLSGDHRYSEYHLVGLLMGLAMYNSIILDLNFPPCCFKKLLTPSTYSEQALGDDAASSAGVGEVSFDLDDLAAVMPTLARSLRCLQEYEGDVEDLCYTFQVSHEVYGTVVTTELVPNGERIVVTNENKNEFIELYIDHLLNKSISQQFAAFYHGFHGVCNSDALKLLCPGEIEALVCGFPEFDLEGLRSSVEYDGYKESDSTIENFWDVLSSFSIGECRKLMVFVTGSYRIPVGGMSSIGFKISRLPFPSSTNTNILPMAHTCFNQFLLPPYTDKETLREKLLVAISNSEGFGIV